jgi:hypothetical protein
MVLRSIRPKFESRTYFQRILAFEFLLSSRQQETFILEALVSDRPHLGRKGNSDERRMDEEKATKRPFVDPPPLGGMTFHVIVSLFIGSAALSSTYALRSTCVQVQAMHSNRRTPLRCAKPVTAIPPRPPQVDIDIPVCSQICNLRYGWLESKQRKISCCWYSSPPPCSSAGCS